jgi:hypothetical protein
MSTLIVAPAAPAAIKVKASRSPRKAAAAISPKPRQKKDMVLTRNEITLITAYRRMHREHAAAHLRVAVDLAASKYAKANQRTPQPHLRPVVGGRAP